MAELESYIAEMEPSVANNASAHGALERASHILRDDQHADSASAFIAGLVVASTWFPVPGVSTAVFDDLVSTGNIRLIRDDGLRTTVVEAYSPVKST